MFRLSGFNLRPRGISKIKYIQLKAQVRFPFDIDFNPASILYVDNIYNVDFRLVKKIDPSVYKSLVKDLAN